MYYTSLVPGLQTITITLLSPSMQKPLLISSCRLILCAGTGIYRGEFVGSEVISSCASSNSLVYHENRTRSTQTGPTLILGIVLAKNLRLTSSTKLRRQVSAN